LLNEGGTHFEKKGRSGRKRKNFVTFEGEGIWEKKRFETKENLNRFEWVRPEGVFARGGEKKWSVWWVKTRLMSRRDFQVGMTLGKGTPLGVGQQKYQ